jgi:hypothetical protein
VVHGVLCVPEMRLCVTSLTATPPTHTDPGGARKKCPLPAGLSGALGAPGLARGRAPAQWLYIYGSAPGRLRLVVRRGTGPPGRVWYKVGSFRLPSFGGHVTEIHTYLTLDTLRLYSRVVVCEIRKIEVYYNHRLVNRLFTPVA